MLERDWVGHWRRTPERREPEQTFTVADLEAARAAGRREANNALNWETSCIGCGNRLTQSYEERCAGAKEAVEAIAADLRARYAETENGAFLDALALVLKRG